MTKEPNFLDDLISHFSCDFKYMLNALSYPGYEEYPWNSEETDQLNTSPEYAQALAALIQCEMLGGLTKSLLESLDSIDESLVLIRNSLTPPT